MVKQLDPETARKKAWLNRYQDSLRRQKRLAFLIEEARSEATSLQSPGRVRTAPTGVYSDRVANAVQRIDELQQDYSAEVEHGDQIRAEIKTAIEALPEIMQILVLYHRYLQGEKVETVCCSVGCSVSTFRRLHIAALAALKLPENVV